MFINKKLNKRIISEANLDEPIDDEDDDDASSSSSSSSVSMESRPQNEQRQHRCIKQMGKLTKVLRPYLESSMDVEILEKFIETIDENRPILSRISSKTSIGFN